MEERKREILKAVVQEFTSSAVPVGSQALARRYFVNLSSATIRNELADLAELGYLVQPHTSAGRIPTDSGYRYFVDFLMNSASVPARVREFIDVEVRAAPPDSQALVETVAMILAAVTQNASVVTAPHGTQARIKHVDLVSLEPREVLLILLVEGNLLRQQMITLSTVARQQDLTALANKVNRELARTNRDDVEANLQALPEGQEREILGWIRDTLDQFERGSQTLVVHDGVRNLVRQPEFAESSRLRGVLEVLEETRYLAALLTELTRDSDLQILIGSENSTSRLQACTVMLTTYGPSARIKGVLGVVGPTRMAYGQVVSRLRAVSEAASLRMAELN
jgi:heat-inducible transcriptional repressor